MEKELTPMMRQFAGLTMYEIERRINVCGEILKDEFDYAYGANKETIKKHIWNYTKALNLARQRARDGRYKNYEFLISL